MDSTNGPSSLEHAVASSQLFLLFILLTLAFGSFVYYIWAHWICYAVPRLPSRHHNFGGYCEEGAANGSAPVYSAANSPSNIFNKSSPLLNQLPAIQQQYLPANPHPQLHQQSPNHHPHQPPQPTQPDSTISSNTNNFQHIISTAIAVIKHHIQATEILLTPRIENLTDNQPRSDCPDASPNTRYKIEDTNFLSNNHSLLLAQLLSTQIANTPSHPTNLITVSLLRNFLHLDGLLETLHSQNQAHSHPPPSPITSPDIPTPLPHAQLPVNLTPVNIPTLPTTVDPPTSPSRRYFRNQLLRLMQRKSANLTQHSKQISPLISLTPAIPFPPKIKKHNITPSPSRPTPPNHHQQYPPHCPPPFYSNNNNHLLHILATFQLQQSMIYHQQLLHFISIQSHQLQQHQHFHQNIHFPSSTNPTTFQHLQHHPTPHHPQQSYPSSSPHYSRPHQPPDAPIPIIHHNSPHQPYFNHQPPNSPTTTSLPFPGRPQNSIPYKKPYPISHNSPQRCQSSLRQSQFLWRKKSPSLPEIITLETNSSLPTALTPRLLRSCPGNCGIYSPVVVAVT